MNVDKKLDYLEFPASDLMAVQAFYEQAFSWAFTSYGEGYVAFTDGKMDGGFYKSEQVSKVKQGAVLVVLFADDLEATQAVVEKAGGVIMAPIFSFPGGLRFHFADPHGNELAVWSDK